MLLCLSLTGIAQPTVNLANLPKVTIDLKNADPLTPDAFSHFEVIDERPDTARIGIHTFVHTLGFSGNRQLVFQHPAALEIGDYLNTHFARPGASWSALIVLRNLWLSDANYLKEEKVKNPDILEERTHIRLKAEIYAFNDSVYIPILRYDTLQTYKRGNTYNQLNTYYHFWEKDLTDMLSDMTDSASGLAATRIEHGRRLHREDILQYNRSRFDAAIIGNSLLTRGVYTSFEEFRNNAPSIQNFEVKQEKKEKILYIKDANGSSYYTHDAWGYCDGKAIYIMRSGSLYPIWKEGKAFYFFGQAYKESTSPAPPVYVPGTPATVSGVGAPGVAPMYTPGTPGMIAPGTMKTASNKQRIYTVDMDSGGVY
ncbi:hypothetical protein [Puia dinghuensis]|nr:hypothetical protein [Puia dinghuensis]